MSAVETSSMSTLPPLPVKSAFASPDAMLAASRDSFPFESTSLGSINSELTTRPSPLYTRQSSSRSIDSYELLNELGKGAFGIVREAKDLETGHLVACKSIAKDKLTDEMMQEIRLEADIMEHLKGHPNIVNLVEFFEDDVHMHLVQELCVGGDLYSKLLDSPVPLPEAEASYIMRGVLTVLQHCHANGVIYRDVKPDNFLMTAKHAGAMLKATDFGISRFLKEGEILSTYCGTPLYMAPEIFDMAYSFPADVWAAGVMLYWMFCRDFPFTGKNTMELARNVCGKKPVLQGMLWDTVSADAKDLITQMLNKDPTKRPKPEELLKHKWLQQKLPPLTGHSSIGDITPIGSGRKKSSFSISGGAKTLVEAMRRQASGSFGGRWEMHAPLAHAGNTLNIRKLERERNWGEARFCGNQVHWRDAKVWAEVLTKTKWSASPFSPSLSLKEEDLRTSTGSASGKSEGGSFRRADSMGRQLSKSQGYGLRSGSASPKLRPAHSSGDLSKAASNASAALPPTPKPRVPLTSDGPLLRRSRSLLEIYVPEEPVELTSTVMSADDKHRQSLDSDPFALAMAQDQSRPGTPAVTTPGSGKLKKMSSSKRLLQKMSSFFK